MEKVMVNGVQIAYKKIGKGIPLVMIHGYPLDHSIWDAMVPLLQDQFELILPDLRGFGQSDVVESEYLISEMAADIASLLDHMEIKQAVIAGHSMGGYIALAFASAHPERVLGLGLVATQSLADTPDKKKDRYAAAENVSSKGAELVAEGMPSKLTTNENIQSSMRELILKQKPAGIIGALKAMAEREDTTDQLEKFNFPVVIIIGMDDQLIPPQRGREMKSKIKHAHLVEILNAGHMPMMEAPQAISDALKILAQ